MASSRFAEFQNSAPQSVIAEHQNSAPESIAAEYQHSAPESVEPPKFAEHDVDTAPQFHFNDDPRSAPEVVMSSEKELLGFDEDVPKKRRFCGLAKSTVIILVLVAVVVVVGAVVGGVLATRNTRQGKSPYAYAHAPCAFCGWLILAKLQQLQRKNHPQHPHLLNPGLLLRLHLRLRQQPLPSRVPYTERQTSPM